MAVISLFIIENLRSLLKEIVELISKDANIVDEPNLLPQDSNAHGLNEDDVRYCSLIDIFTASTYI